MSGALDGIYQNISYALNINTEAIMELEGQAATGNRVNRASDSPTSAYRILSLSSQERSLQDYQDTISTISDQMEVATSVVSEVLSSLSNTVADLTQIVGGTYNEDLTGQVIEQLNTTLEQLASLANTQHADQYLFGGDDTGSAPFTVDRNDGVVTSVTYQGSEDARAVSVSSGLDIEATLIGSQVFGSGNDREDPVFAGTTGVRAGTGTSNVTGDVWMTVDYDGSNYRISIDDGATWTTVPTGGDTNQMLTDSETGEVMYVDTTGITGEGTELVRVPGTYDLFSTLISIRDILQNDRGLTHQDVLNYVDSSLSSLQEAEVSLTQAEVSVGLKVGFLSTLTDTLDSMEYSTYQERVSLQEADIAQISVDLARREVLYEMSLSIAGTLLQTNLLNYL